MKKKKLYKGFTREQLIDMSMAVTSQPDSQYGIGKFNRVPVWLELLLLKSEGQELTEDGQIVDDMLKHYV